MRLSGRIVGVRSTEQSVGIKSGAFDPDIIIRVKRQIRQQEFCSKEGTLSNQNYCQQ